MHEGNALVQDSISYSKRVNDTASTEVFGDTSIADKMVLRKTYPRGRGIKTGMQ